MSSRHVVWVAKQVSNAMHLGHDEELIYPSLVNASLAHMALNVAELIRRLVDGGRSNRRGRGTCNKVVLSLFLQLLMAADGNASWCGLGVGCR